MRALLRELESNQLALLVVTLAFLLLLAIVGIVAAQLFGVDLNYFLGIGGMGTGSHASTAVSQASQARSPNYTPAAQLPIVSSIPVTPAPPPASTPGPTPPGGVIR